MREAQRDDFVAPTCTHYLERRTESGVGNTHGEASGRASERVHSLTIDTPFL